MVFTGYYKGLLAVLLTLHENRGYNSRNLIFRGESVSTKWLSVQQVADELNLSIETIRNYINHPNPKERLRAAKFGRDWRIKREDLDEWIKAHENVRDDES